MLPDKAKSVVCSIISLALVLDLVIGQLQKPARFSAFHWSTSRSQAFVGQLLGKSNKAKSVVCSIISLALSNRNGPILDIVYPILTIFLT